MRKLQPGEGRVERDHRTLQDQLMKELRLAGVNDTEGGNAFLPAFVERFNQRFSVRAAKPEDLHRPVNALLLRGSAISYAIANSATSVHSLRS